MLGYLLIIAGNASIAIGVLLIRLLTSPKNSLNPLNPFLVTSLVALFGSILLLPILFAYHQEVKELITQQQSKLVYIVIAGLFYVTMGELLFNIGVSKLDENALSTAGLLALSFPLFTALAGHIFLNESINLVKFVIAFIFMSTGFLIFVSGK